MTDQLTLYSRLESALPDDEMAALGVDVCGTDARYERDDDAHVYRWGDLSVRCTAMPRAEMAAHLEGFAGFLRARAAEPDVDAAALAARVAETTLVVGVVIEPGHDADGRTEELIGRMVGGLEPLVFMPHGLYDEHGRVQVWAGAPRPDERPDMTGMPEDAVARRDRSVARLRAEGVPVLETLPLIESASEVTLRSREEVVERAIGLALIAARGEGLALEQTRVLIDEWSAQLTPAESAFLAVEEPTDTQRAQFTWRYEGLAVLLWALGHLDDQALGPPDHIVDVPTIIDIVVGLGPAGFRAAGALRDVDTQLDAADLMFRYDWAAVDARVQKRPPPPSLDPGVVYERHYALNWLIGYGGQSWDDVTTDT